jgi:hypothetical protein
MAFGVPKSGESTPPCRFFEETGFEDRDQNVLARAPAPTYWAILIEELTDGRSSIEGG